MVMDKLYFGRGKDPQPNSKSVAARVSMLPVISRFVHLSRDAQPAYFWDVLKANRDHFWIFR